MERYSNRAIEIINELHTERLDYESEYIPLINCVLQCKEYEDAEEQGLLVRLHEGTTFSQIRAIMKLCERINGAKARKGQETEPLITWQLYNILCKTFRVDDEAEKALKEANRNG